MSSPQPQPQSHCPSHELMDPITLDWLDDPISLVCCGKIISRLSLTTALVNRPECPLCNTNLDHFDADSAPMCPNIAYMVEEATKNSIVSIFI